MMRTKTIIAIIFLILVIAGTAWLAFFRGNRVYASTKLTTHDAGYAWPNMGNSAFTCIETGLAVRSSSGDVVVQTASIAKIITALAVMRKQPLSPGQKGQTYVIIPADVERYRAYVAKGCSVLPVRTGLKLTQYEAMQRMLIASDNNMADLLAERVFGSRHAYLIYAAAMLKMMGLARTVITDANGVSAATVSTPSELIVIGTAALNNPVIAKIVSQRRAHLPGTGTIKNTNRLLGTADVIGIKTGTTQKAGSCLLFASRYTNVHGQRRTIVAAVMGSSNHETLYRDSRVLLSSVRQRIEQYDQQIKADRLSSPLASKNPTSVH
ncbi:MAG: D-alanyl-D-alanine carboxypeptidase [Chitinophagaceae bacterium]|nr:MAG: D-alanyl-D-alanine carboxypeptidase [Chitinophagaceae bacterium]